MYFLTVLGALDHVTFVFMKLVSLSPTHTRLGQGGSTLLCIGWRNYVREGKI